MERRLNARPTLDFDRGSGKTNDTRVISEEGSVGLRVSKSGEDGSCADSMLGVDEYGAVFSFGDRVDNDVQQTQIAKTEPFREGVSAVVPR